jgi:hypothetical protein
MKNLDKFVLLDATLIRIARARSNLRSQRRSFVGYDAQ